MLCIPFNTTAERLQNAIQNKSLKQLKEALSEPNADINAYHEGRTALHVAVETHNLEIVKFLIEKEEIDINVKTLESEETALHIAARHCIDFPELCLTLFIHPKADLAAKNEAGEDPILSAATQGKTQVIQFFEKNVHLIFNDTRIHSTDKYELLRYARSLDSSVIHEFLIDRFRQLGIPQSKFTQNPYATYSTKPTAAPGVFVAAAAAPAGASPPGGPPKMVNIQTVIDAVKAKRIDRRGGVSNLLAKFLSIIGKPTRLLKKQVSEAFIQKLERLKGKDGQTKKIPQEEMDKLLAAFSELQKNVEVSRTKKAKDHALEYFSDKPELKALPSYVQTKNIKGIAKEDIREAAVRRLYDLEYKKDEKGMNDGVIRYNEKMALKAKQK